MASPQAGKLMDRKTIQAELGVTKGTAAALMSELEKVRVGRRVFVKRADLERWIEANTLTPLGFRKTA